MGYQADNLVIPGLCNDKKGALCESCVMGLTAVRCKQSSIKRTLTDTLVAQMFRWLPQLCLGVLDKERSGDRRAVWL